MKVTYRTTRKKVGMLGKKTNFFVNIKVTISSEEKSIIDEFGALTSFDIDDRLADAGHTSTKLNVSIFESGTEFRFETIQLAANFLDQVLSGLEKAKEQIERTREDVAMLDEEFTREF